MTVHVYAIRCTATSGVYVGCSGQISKRWISHRCDLKNGDHKNSGLQADWNKHGEKAFEFVILETLDDEADRKAAELSWIDQIATYNEFIKARHGGFTTIAPHRENMVEHTRRRWAEGDPTLKAGLDKALGVAHANATSRLESLWENPDYRSKQEARLAEMRTPEHQKAATETRWAQDGAHEHQSAKLTEAWKSREKKSGLPRGVTRIPNSDRFKASMWKDGKNKHLGCFGTIEEAAAAYQAASLSLSP